MATHPQSTPCTGSIPNAALQNGPRCTIFQLCDEWLRHKRSNSECAASARYKQKAGSCLSYLSRRSPAVGQEQHSDDEHDSQATPCAAASRMPGAANPFDKALTCGPLPHPQHKLPVLIRWFDTPVYRRQSFEKRFVINTVYAQSYFPPSDSKWHTLSTDSLGWSKAALTDLHDYLDDKDSKAFIILKNGKIAIEWYFDSFSRTDTWYWASAGKTLTAFLIGLAQQEGTLDIDDPASDYLGSGWTHCDAEREHLITVRHQLSMTTGLDDGSGDRDCTDPDCLICIAEPGSRWAYHNAPNTLLGEVLEAATGMNKNSYTYHNLKKRIGMDGVWVQLDYSSTYFSTARSMARFGILIQNRGVWESDTLMRDTEYFNAMINTSQNMNPSYGYLWWLNGKSRHMLPQTRIIFQTDMIPQAPDDLIAALGKNDQKLYVVNSLDLVVRMGEASGNSKLAVSSFDNELWSRIMALYDTPSAVRTKDSNTPPRSVLLKSYPNPFNPVTTINYRLNTSAPVSLFIYNMNGQPVRTLLETVHHSAGEYTTSWNGTDDRGNHVSSGVYLMQLRSGTRIETHKNVLTR